jgi:hypothetical protein
LFLRKGYSLVPSHFGSRIPLWSPAFTIPHRTEDPSTRSKSFTRTSSSDLWGIFAGILLSTPRAPAIAINPGSQPERQRAIPDDRSPVNNKRNGSSPISHVQHNPDEIITNTHFDTHPPASKNQADN